MEFSTLGVISVFNEFLVWESEFQISRAWTGEDGFEEPGSSSCHTPSGLAEAFSSAEAEAIFKVTGAGICKRAER